MTSECSRISSVESCRRASPACTSPPSSRSQRADFVFLAEFVREVRWPPLGLLDFCDVCLTVSRRSFCSSEARLVAPSSAPFARLVTKSLFATAYNAAPAAGRSSQRVVPMLALCFPAAASATFESRSAKSITRSENSWTSAICSNLPYSRFLDEAFPWRLSRKRGEAGPRRREVSSEPWREGASSGGVLSSRPKGADVGV